MSSQATGLQSVPEWIAFVGRAQSAIGSLLTQSTFTIPEDAGYRHTLREILQQPDTWLDTATRMSAQSASLLAIIGNGLNGLSLTGSGSSQFAGQCAAPFLQERLGIPVQTIPAGDLIVESGRALPPGRPSALVSLARSGNSPESCAAVSMLLASEPDCSHVLITCNSEGRLAVEFQDEPRARVLSLHPDTCDVSLAMTSSFTNMALAAAGLGMLAEMHNYRQTVARLAAAARSLLLQYTNCIAAVSQTPFTSAVFLGSRCRFGAARESALKLQEMTGGRVFTLAETFLGLRHGPMASVREDTLVVCYLSSDPLMRAYEMDLFRELTRKGLGGKRVVVGEKIPAEAARAGDLAIDIAGLSAIGDDFFPVLDVVVGQLLAFFRSMAEGLRPDQPSANGAISRVVEQFAIYRRPVESRQ